MEKNDRGALIYRNTGEVGPNLVISNCMIQKNGHHLFGNISTATHAVELHFHNTLVSNTSFYHLYRCFIIFPPYPLLLL